MHTTSMITYLARMRYNSLLSISLYIAIRNKDSRLLTHMASRTGFVRDPERLVTFCKFQELIHKYDCEVKK